MQISLLPSLASLTRAVGQSVGGLREHLNSSPHSQACTQSSHLCLIPGTSLGWGQPSVILSGEEVIRGWGELIGTGVLLGYERPHSMITHCDMGHICSKRKISLSFVENTYSFGEM